MKSTALLLAGLAALVAAGPAAAQQAPVKIGMITTLLATPCTWLEEFTPRGNWPAGSTREGLAARLGTHFVCELQRDMPFLIREHARKYQWSVALGTRWIRRR